MRSGLENYDYEAYRQRVRQLVEITAGGNISVFAKKCGISDMTIHHWIVEGRLPTGDTLVKLVRAYNVNTNWLLLGASDKAKQ